jgi:hypothetical protein
MRESALFRLPRPAKVLAVVSKKVNIPNVVRIEIEFRNFVQIGIDLHSKYTIK